MKHNDIELIQRTLTGDDDAFSVLVRKYQKQVHALAWRIIGDFHIAEEITQDSFLKAYMELKTLKEPQRFGSWISVITRRSCFTWLRKKRLWTESFEHLEQTDNEQIEETVYSEYVVEEKERTAAETQREVVKKLLAKLQESERTVMTLHYFGEMTCAEIGEFLGVSANTIKSRLRRAQQRLKKEESIIREALDNFKITPNLTENIMREVSRTKPAAPSGSKPFVPWLFAASTVVVVLLVLGLGNSRFLTRFQQPYSFDADSEVEIDIVEAPVMADLALKSDVRRKLESANAQSENPVSEQKPNDTLLSAEAGEENKMENYPQWNLPEKAKARLGKGRISEMQFSPDGTQLVVCSRIGVWVYDVATGKEISFLSGMSGAMAYSPDGRFIATSKGDKISSLGINPREIGVVLWDISAGSEVSLQEDLPAAAMLRFSDDSKTLIFLSMSRETIYRVDVETGKTTTTQMGERLGKENIHLESYTLTEDIIAIGSRDGKIELWDMTTGKKLSTLGEIGKRVITWDRIAYTNHAITMKFSPDGTRLATGNLDTTVQLWDTTSGEELTVLQKPIEGNMWSVSKGNGKEIVNNPMKEERLGRPSKLAFSPDNTLLACGSEDCTVKLWNTITGELVTTFIGHLSTVDQLTFSPDGTLLASGSDDGTVRFWDVKMRKALQTRIAGHMWISTASFFDGGSKLASVSSNGIITVWDLKNSRKTTSISKMTLEEPLYWGTYRHLVLSPDGTKLTNYGKQSDPSKPNFNESVLRLTDVNTGRELVAFPRGNGRVFSPDGKILASGQGNKILLLNIETGEKREIIAFERDDDSDEYKPRISRLAFSPDGERIISSTRGGHVQLWDAETGMELSSFFEDIPPKGNRYKETIQHFAFSSDGLLIAVGSTKRIRMIGRAKQPHFKEYVYGYGEYNDTFIFSPDDTILIVGIQGGKIELWDVATGDKLTSLNGHSVGIEDLKFSPDNKTLMSVGGGNILFWDWEKVLANARGEDQERESEVNLFTEEKSTEPVLQFLEHSQQKPKTSDHILWKGEVYLANEWYDVAYQEFLKYLTAADFPSDQDVGTSPSFHRQLFARIGKVGKDVQDKEGFADMVNKLIDAFPDSMSIQLNAHLVLAKFYHDNDILEKADEHIQKIDDITADLSAQGLTFQVNVYLSIASYYHNTDMLDKADEYIQEIENITTELDPNDHGSLRLQLATHFGLAEHYREHGNLEKADQYIQKTGFVTEDAWMVLGPFDNAGGIGYNTAYIPEDITEIDLDIKYDGLDGLVGWKKFTDAELDGYIHLGEKNVDWQISYTFATVNSPDERDVQFRFDSDDQGKVWLNGKEVFSHTKAFMAIIDTYTIPVTLKPGKNSILVKVCNEGGACAFYMRITDQNGQPYDDLKFDK